MARIYFYTRFERFWHWFHNATAFTWGGLYVFILFWLVITGQWKQYLPTLKNVGLVLRYYLIGILKGEPHPAKKRWRASITPSSALPIFPS